ncbi:MAG: HNH endonuclease, partial [Actinobacteria bacterium]|nr:HNH endonuclease [Actinomycetota bacterium]
ELWRHDGHRSCVEFVSAVCQVSNWKARRWIEAGHVLEHLPLTAAALESGALSLDKVVELARFATPADELRWVRWAQKTTTGGVRARADKEVKRDQDEAAAVEATRYLTHSRWDDHIWIEARLPAEEGERVVKAIDELAAELPAHPDDEVQEQLLGDDLNTIDQRRADAFVQLVTSSTSAASSDTTMVVHATVEALVGDKGSASIAGGLNLHPETARRLCCDSKIRTVVEDGHGGRLGIGDTSRVVPKWLRCEVLERDDYVCSFPGCEHSRYLDIHHVIHWLFGGETELDNLLTLCHYHHKLIHEYRWSVTLGPDQRPIWFRPGGRVYEPGPAPPTEIIPPKKDPPLLAEAIGFSRLLGLAAVL